MHWPDTRLLNGVICSFITMMRSQGSALSSLPGPEYGFLGLTEAFFSKDPHRWTAEWANKYGPIVRVRVLCFYVSSLICQAQSSEYVLFCLIMQLVLSKYHGQTLQIRHMAGDFLY